MSWINIDPQIALGISATSCSTELGVYTVVLLCHASITYLDLSIYGLKSFEQKGKWSTTMNARDSCHPKPTSPSFVEQSGNVGKIHVLQY